jgi:predicted  nucleic acid-binding Zn-ribbon protein
VLKSPIKAKNPLKIKADIQKTEENIARSNAKITECETLMSNIDQTRDTTKYQQAVTAYKAAQDKLATLEAQWLELQQQLES